MIYLEAHPIDPSILNCCYIADNNDWSHRQQPKYQRFIKSAIITENQEQESTNQGMPTKKKKIINRKYKCLPSYIFTGFTYNHISILLNNTDC